MFEPLKKLLMRKSLFTLTVCFYVASFGLQAQTSTTMEDWVKKNDCLLRSVTPASVAIGEDGNCPPPFVLSSSAQIFDISPVGIDGDEVSCQIVLIRDSSSYYGAYVFQKFTTVGSAFGNLKYNQKTNYRTGQKKCMLVYETPALVRPKPIN